MPATGAIINIWHCIDALFPVFLEASRWEILDIIVILAFLL